MRPIGIYYARETESLPSFVMKKGKSIVECSSHTSLNITSPLKARHERRDSVALRARGILFNIREQNRVGRYLMNICNFDLYERIVTYCTCLVR